MAWGGPWPCQIKITIGYINIDYLFCNEIVDQIRLVPVVIWLYLTFVHAASVFSLPISTTITDLTILEFIFWTTKLRKQLYKNLKYDI
jgi:hypothetical protein